MRTLLISGASRGIGRSIAERLLADGHRLSLGLRNQQALAGTALDPAVAGAGSGAAASLRRGRPGGGRRLGFASTDHFGGFDAVIHSAGIFSRAGVLFEAGQEEEINRTMAVNLMALVADAGGLAQPGVHGEGRLQMLVSMSGKRSKGRLAWLTPLVILFWLSRQNHAQ